MSFFHLHAHSEFSIADGLHSPKKWAKALKERGFKAHALTDHGSMGGCVQFYQAMKAEKLHPILGCEFYFVGNPLDHTTEAEKPSHLVLLAKTYQGWLNLLKLQKLGFTSGFYYRPRIGWSWLSEYSEGLICLTACLGGIIGKQVINDEIGKAGLNAKKLYNIFKGDLYIEFQGHDAEKQRQVNKFLKKIPFARPIITNDVHYISPEHHKIQQLVKQDAYRNAEKAVGYAEFDRCYLASPKEIYGWFRKDHSYLDSRFVIDAMKNTQDVFEKCKDFELPEGKRYLPVYKVEGCTSAEFFKKTTTKALGQFLRENTVDRKTYIERFAKEYKVIAKYNLQDYFLIIWDIVRWAKEQGIYVGLGRGSAAGSLISYLLGIVKLDPIPYKLLFERFLNANRCETGELPDVDLDFESLRRNEVKEYVFNLYGRDNVCEIGSYGRLKLKSSILGFGKAFHVSYTDLLSITTKLDLDKEDAQSLDAAMDESPVLRSIMKKNPDLAYAVREVNGQIKSQSIHPAGVVISSKPIHTIIPVKSQALRDAERVKKEGKRVIVTQCEDKDVISSGLVKMDFLGIKEYDIFKHIIENSSCKFTADNYVEKILETIGSDEKVWEFFQQGRNEGIFQFGSSGMKELLKLMKSDCLNDLIAAVALYRPGCIANGWHYSYCKRKSGEEDTVYPHEDVEAALADTYGIPVFQEQIMEIIHVIGEVPMNDADTIRSALGKKDKKKLGTFKKQFISNAEKKLESTDKASALWDQLEASSGYSFNRSHAAVYALVAFISQSFKVNNPAEFWAAVLSWDAKKGKWEDLAANKKAALAMGVQICLPDINRSQIGCIGSTEYTDDILEVIGGTKVLWSLCGVKSVGEKTAQEIISKQPFTDLEDFFTRVHKSKCKFNTMLALAYSGAFDGFGDRREMIQKLYKLKKLVSPKLTDDHMIFQFYDFMGFFEEKLKKLYGFSKSLCTEEDIKEMEQGELVSAGGMISDYKIIKTKKGDKMARVNLVDLDEKIELTLFPETWSSYSPLVKKGSLIQVIGYKSGYGGKTNAVNVDEIETIH